LVSPLLISINSLGAKSGLVAQVITPASRILSSLSPSPVIFERSSFAAPDVLAVVVLPAPALSVVVALLVLAVDVVTEPVFEALFVLSVLVELPEQAVSIVAKVRVKATTSLTDFFIVYLLSVNKYSSFELCYEQIISQINEYLKHKFA